MKKGLALYFILLVSLSYLLHLYFLTFKRSLYKDQLVKPLLVQTSSTLRFHVIGDFGMMKTYIDFPELPLKLVANAMNKQASENPISMILTVGDNFYPTLRSSLDPIANSVLQILFNQSHLQDIPMYLLYGNHDCYYNSHHGYELEMLYPNVYMPAGPWNMTVPIGNKTASFLFLSCSLICYGFTPDYHVEFQCGKFDDKFNSTYEYTLIEEYLKTVDEDENIAWSFVFVHFPVVSISLSGGDNENFKEFLLPLLLKYGVDAVFSGHNHNIQYLTIDKSLDFSEMNITQDYQPICYKYSRVSCYDDHLACEYRNTTCPTTNKTCANVISLDEANTKLNNPSSANYTKGEHLHQIIQGGSGANIDPLCPNTTSPIADDVYALCDFGFTEVTLTDTSLELKHIQANTSKVLFTSIIKE